MVVFLGKLGKLNWFRCRFCGIEFSVEDGDEFVICPCCLAEGEI